MIKLTSAKAELYEYMKTGRYNYKELVTGTGIPYDTVKTYMAQFVTGNLAQRHPGFTYTANDFDYFVDAKSPGYKKKPKIYKGEGMPVITLTPDQELYLRNHLHEPRSKLVRKLGIPRLLLNFAIVKLGGKVG